jgi:UPF0716 protein FxsA
MFLAIFLLYVIVEVAVLVWVGSAIGVLWTVALIVGSSLVGLVLFASQSRRALVRLSRATRGEAPPAAAIADSVIITAGGLLLLVPGLVTSVLGLLALFPPTRFLIRPALAFAAARRLGPMRVMMAGGAVRAGSSYAAARRAHQPHVVEGEVIDSRIVPEEPGPGPQLHRADTPVTSEDDSRPGHQAD